MRDMNVRRSQLDPETVDALSDTLLRQGREALDISLDLDKRLTNTNFLTNGGAAVALLAYLTEHSLTDALAVSLILFTAGVVATGVELRALLKLFGEIHKDVSRRQDGFLNDTLTVREAGLIGERDVGVIYKNINHYAGWVSQICFLVGVVIGIVGFLAEQ